MMFLVEHWRWFASGLFVLMMAGIILNPVAALKVFDEIGGFVLDKIAAVVAWAREPHDWWRITCLTLALCFTAASFVAWDARQTIVVVKQQCEAKVLAIQSECAAVESQANTIVLQTNAEAKRQIEQAKRDARDERDAKVAARAEASRLKDEANDFDKRMEQARKNPDCDALLNIDVGAKCGLL